MKTLTQKELRDAQYDISKDLELPQIIDGVSFGVAGGGTIKFRYGNASGLIFPDNGYLGRNEDGKDYYLLWKLSCQYNQECKFNPSFQPNLASAVSAIKASWKLFTK